MGGKHSLVVLVGASVLAVAACSEQRHAEGEPGRTPERGPAPAAMTGDTRANPEPETGDWIRPGKDYAGTRYSGLADINTSNVSHLAVVGTFSTSVLRGHEAAPVVVNGTMYIVTPYPNILYALDLTKPGFPAKWAYQPNPDRAAQGEACCDVVNRGVVYDAGKIFMNTLDGHTVAVDANTGKEIWNTKLGDINLGETITMAPLVAKGKVFVGNSGGEMGVRGWVAALDENSGKLAWRAYSTGPDKDVLIGSRFHAFYT